MTDFIDTLIDESIERTNKGYYDIETRITGKPRSLVKAIMWCEHIPIIAEIKKRSPTFGTIRDELDPVQISLALKNGGAAGISVITEPTRFSGSLQILKEVNKTVDLPLLMKDIVTNEVQVEAASRLGADSILLIATLFKRNVCERTIEEMIELAHSKSLEVILETHNEQEFLQAIRTKADIIGINNRDLSNLSVNTETSYKILKNQKPRDRIVIVESGIKERKQVDRLLKVGADGFLIGSSIMKAKDIEHKLREFTTTNERS